VTRSKELRRIEAAIVHKNEAELRWALAQCELRKQLRDKGVFKGHSPLSYRIEKAVRAALDEITAS
jgi:hypothetical protein